VDVLCVQVPLQQSLLCPGLRDRVPPLPQLQLLPPQHPQSTAGGGGGAWEKGTSATAGFGAGEGESKGSKLGPKEEGRMRLGAAG